MQAAFSRLPITYSLSNSSIVTGICPIRGGSTIPTAPGKRSGMRSRQAAIASFSARVSAMPLARS